MEPTASVGLLDGITVLDLSRILAGPYACQLLADMGAEVIKVEPPTGDPARQIGPHVEGHSIYFASLNSSKKGIVLDLRKPAGKAALRSLIAGADIVIENFRPAASKRLGLDPTYLLECNPALVVVSISGFARGTSREDLPALDLTVQAETGIMSVTGEPGSAPIRAGVPLGDLAAGMWAALAAITGYMNRLRNGRGIALEVPLADATYAMTSYVATAAIWRGENPPPVGSGHHSVVPYGAYPTVDGWIAIAVIGDQFWGRLTGALDINVATFGDFSPDTNEARCEHREEIDHAVAKATSQLSTVQAAERLAAAGVPHAPVNGVLDALRTPYAVARGFVADVPTESFTYQVVRGPLNDQRPLRSAPKLGEHTSEVLRRLIPHESPLLRELLPTQDTDG